MEWNAIQDELKQMLELLAEGPGSRTGLELAQEIRALLRRVKRAEEEGFGVAVFKRTVIPAPEWLAEWVIWEEGNQIFVLSRRLGRWRNNTAIHQLPDGVVFICDSGSPKLYNR